MDVSVAPFVWAPGMRGQLEQGPVVIPLEAGVADLAGGVQVGGMLHADVTGKGIHASTQVIYLDFHDRNFTPVFGADVRAKLFTFEALAGPHLKRGRFEMAPMLGFRHTRIDGQIAADGSGALKTGKHWTEGLTGLELQYALNERAMLRARGVVAIAGPAGQSSTDLVLAGTYRLNQQLSLALGYRWARERVRPKDAGQFGMDLKADGPVVGLVIGI